MLALQLRKGMFLGTKYRNSAISRLESSRDDLQDYIEAVGEKGLVGISAKDPVRKETDAQIEQMLVTLQPCYSFSFLLR